MRLRRVEMGTECQYHVTMLISGDQEDAIRLMFKEKHWPCLLSVLSNETVTEIIQSGFTDVFPFPAESHDSGGVGGFREIKSEVVNLETEDSLTKEYKTAAVKHEAPRSSDDEDDEDEDDDDDDMTDENDVNDEDPNESTSFANNDDETTSRRRHSKTKKRKVDKSAKMFKNLKRRVKCPLCDLELASKSILKRHCLRRHPDEWFEFKCADCPSMFKTQCDHVIAVCHNDQADTTKNFKRFKPATDLTETCIENVEPDKCVPADKCVSESEYDSCEGTTSKSTNWAVKILNESSQRKEEELWKHRDDVKHEPPKKTPKQFEKSNHTPEELREMGHLQCNACGKFFHNDRMLRKHLYYAHRDLMPVPICAVCDTQFKTRQELWKHKKETNHNDCVSLLKHYQCDSCGKILKGGYYSFVHHKKLACGKEEKELEELKVLPCDICGSTFKTKHQIQCHKKAVHLDAPEVCDVCGNVYKNQLALRAHKKRHDEKNRKYACKDCGRSFFNSTLLKQHIRTHTKEKPFKCPMCNYTSACKENIGKHTLSVHKVKAKAIDLRKQKFSDPVTTATNEVNDNNQGIETNNDNDHLFHATAHNAEKILINEQNPTKIMESSEPAPSSYVELMNCDVNPHAYGHTGIDPVQYQYPWGDPPR